MGPAHAMGNPATNSGQKAQLSRRSRRGKIENALCSSAFTISALLVYANANILMFIWGAHEEYIHTTRPVMRWLIAIARGFGYTLNLNCSLVIFLACRSLLTWARGIRLASLVVPVDKAFPGFHKLVGFTILVSVAGHAVFHLAWIVMFRGWRAGLWQINMCVSTGAVITVIILGMSLLGFAKPKAKHFRGLFAFHLYGAALFFPLLVLHGQFRAKPYTWKWIVAPVIVYICDRASRIFRTATSQVCGAETFVVHSGDITGVTIRRHFEFKSGQYAELQIPSIDSSWHPFTIASAPHENELRFYIRSAGRWTGRLLEIAKSMTSGDSRSSAQTIDVKCRGPYGAPAQHVSNYNSVILISGGVGATPFCSVALSAKRQIENALPASECSSAHASQGSLLLSSDASLSEKIERAFRRIETLDGTSEECEVACENTLRASIAVSQATGALGDLPEEQLLVEEDQDVETMIQDHSFWGTEGSDDELFDGGEEASTSVPMPSYKSRSWKKVHDSIAGKRYRFFQWLHSVRFNFAMMWIVIGRLFLVLYASAFVSVSLSNGNPILFTSSYVGALDWVAGLVVFFSIALAISFELYYLGGRIYFSSFGRCIDFSCLIPVSVLSTYIGAIPLHSAIRGFDENNPRALALIHLLVFLPLLVLLLAARMYRVIGARVLLADTGHQTTFAAMENMDFIWTTQTSKHDEWLVNEMSNVAGGRFVHLHRYITREEPVGGVESGRTENGIRTVHGERPDFLEIFENVAQRAASESKVGVFFCGPPAMGKSIKYALMKAQARSNFRGSYLYSQRRKMKKVVPKDARGSFVRFVFREENF